MERRRFLKTAFGLSLAGTLFAGYLSGVKLLSKSCAFGESCPLFLGYPACYFGFAIFASLLALSGGALAKKRTDAAPVKALLALSALGSVFAGSFVADEIASWIAAAGVVFYGLGLPTCVYGLVFYLAILALSLGQLRAPPPPPPVTPGPRP